MFLPSKAALATLPDHATKTLFYTPSTAREFQQWKVSNKDRGESMKELFSIGKCSTKYMKVQTVPRHLPNSDSVRSRQDYKGRPAVDFQDNQELRELFAPSKKPSVSPALGISRTKYSVDFVRPTSEQMRRARHVAEAITVDTNRTMGGPGDMMIRTSLSSDHFARPQARWVSAPCAPRDNIELMQTEFKPMTQYTATFSKQPRVRASRTVGLSQPRTPSSTNLRRPPSSSLGHSAPPALSVLSASMPLGSDVGSALPDADGSLLPWGAIQRNASCPSNVSLAERHAVT